ncbi:ABC transporter ATP-binding protein [Pseudoalteromonas piscicida]|uniref:ABC transporter ATP-binding protein n=1 Tax=Pseudoalteromonas piscicida TaxID=43662 RepID=UPI001C9499B6|nr:ABC transporter ATP-binding protein [Pseudoalteromonas piscicida]MCG9771189.1 ABC transporter ATP-binding protein [Pseudoalteromonas piscicida]QZO15131.1 ABC transporter ATP-binding protein [Pseudoalteromonas piscicida]
MMLKVENLTIDFRKHSAYKRAIHSLSFTINEGEILGIVGESGSGKSIVNYAIMGLLPDDAKVNADSLLFNGRSLLSLTSSEIRSIRGKQVAMIFQDPMSALNPCFSIEYQLIETLREHYSGLSKSDYRQEALKLLIQVGINEAEARLKSYPHELSGGMAQRVMIAMALACKPKLLIADEPTTALDVTIQAQILALLKTCCKELNMAMILVSHDIEVVRSMADRIQVMYSGEIVEQGTTEDVLSQPLHPYTQGLIRSIPVKKRSSPAQRLEAIKGGIIPVDKVVVGCRFASRCPSRHELCDVKPVLRASQSGVNVRCHLGANL